MSALGKFNYYFLQWLFLRLAYTLDDDGAVTEWGVCYFVVPLTGYDGEKFRYLQGRRGYRAL